MPKQTPTKQVLFASTLRHPVSRVFAVVLTLLVVVTASPVSPKGLLRHFLPSQPVATAATTNTLNFQARLQNAAGAIVADGTYNIEFNLYTASSGGSSLWTEDYLNSASQGVTVKNGYVTVNLGSITAFPSTINWDQNLYLGMTVRGTGSCTFGTCTPTDAEMTPRLQLTASAYAFKANQLAQYDSGTTFTSTLKLAATTTGGNQVFQVQDAGAAGTYTLLTSANGIQLQGSTPGSAQTGNFNVTGTGIVGILQAASGLSVTAGATTLTGATTGDALTVSNNTSTGNIAVFKDNSTTVATIADGGAVKFQNSVDSNAALRVMNAAGTDVLRVNTLTGAVGINVASPLASLHVGLDPGGTYSNGFETGALAPFTSVSSWPWYVESSFVNSGSFAAQAGALPNGQSTALTLTKTISSAGTVSFVPGVSSEAGFDFLRFYIDGVQKGQWSGNLGFSTGVVSYATVPGSHTFSWAYEKDGNTVYYSDTAWVDDISITNVAGSSTSAAFDGNVGIGTAFPSARLHVTGGDTLLSNTSTTALKVQTAAAVPVLTVDTTNSQTILRGINSDAVLGSELVTSQNFTSATYWSPNNTTWTTTATTAAHVTGNTTAMTATATNVPVVAGNTYQVTFTVAGNSTTTNTVTPNIGGVAGPSLGANATHTVVITAIGTGLFNLTPSTNFNGTISNVSIKILTLAKSVLTVQDSTGTSNLEVRASTQFGNQFIGLQSGRVNTTGSGNTASGTYSLYSNTTGGNNTATGVYSLQSNTTGYQNTSTGAYTLYSNTSGYANSASGYNSLFSNTTGYYNTASGYYSLQSNTTGFANTASGYNTLKSNTTGTFNTAIGGQSLQANTTGANNTGIGISTLFSNTTGTGNAALGYGGLYSNTNGLSNTALGSSALYFNTTGNYNTASGEDSLQANTTGNYNTASGKYGLMANTTGSYNTALGTYAGYQDANSNFKTLAALQRATAIGAYAQVQANDSIVLGSVDNATKIGIGTTVPLNTFSVSPLDYQTGTATRTNSSATLTGTGTTWTAAMVGDVIVFADGTTNTVTGFTNATTITMGTTYAGTTDASPVYYRFHKIGLQVTSAGNVGLGTTSPSQLLDIRGAYRDQVTGIWNGVTGTFSGSNNVSYIELGQGTFKGTVEVTITADKDDAVGRVTRVYSYTSTGSLLSYASSTTTEVNGLISNYFSLGDVEMNLGPGMVRIPIYALDTFGNHKLAVSVKATSVTSSEVDTVLNSTNLTTPTNVVNSATRNYINAGGATTTCSGGQFLQNQIVVGGIVTGGTCAAAGGSGVNTVGALDGGTANANGATISSTTIYLQSASNLYAGLVNTGTQTFAGDKTFNGVVALAKTNATALDIAGTPPVSATASLVKIGNAIVGGNAVANGGTYLGLNAPSSGAGSAADFINLQRGGTTTFQVDSTGYVYTPTGFTTGSASINGGSIAGASINVTSGYSLNGTAGATTTCSGGNVLQNQVVQGGIVTGGTCVAAGGGDAYLANNQTFSGNNTFSGTVLLQPASNSTTNFQIKRDAASSNTPVLTVDTANSQTILRGINSDAVLGSELVTSQDFTSATYWSPNNTSWTTTTTTATHVTGNYTSLSATSTNVTVVAGNTYKITFTIASNTTTSNTITPKIGGVSGPKLGANTTHTVVITATTTGALSFTPDNQPFDGTISAVSVKLLTFANSVLTVQNSAGTANLEVRTSTLSGNQFIGLQAGQANATGHDNTASGSMSLQSNTAGNYNVAAGTSSLRLNTTGSNNTGIGYQSLYTNTTGTTNTAVGSNTLSGNTTGSGNNAFGYQSLNNNITGSFNNGYGYYSLYNNTSGSYNVASGMYSLYNNWKGDYNTASGYQSSYNTSSNASNNTSSGSQSLYSNITGSGNAAFGDSALYSITGSYNSGLGYYAGYQDANGHFVTSSNLQRATAIGAYAQVQANDSIVLGSVDNATKIGIGTTVPLNTFSVSPLDYQTGTATRTNSSATLTGTGTTWTAAMVGDVIVFADGTTNTVTGFTNATTITMGTTYAGTTDASPVYYRFHKVGLQVTSAGKIGLGNTSPAYALDVIGDINATGIYRVGGTSGATTTCSGGNVLQNQVVVGGIVTGGTCVAGGGGSGVTTVGTLDGGTANANGATISSTTIYLQSASNLYAGVVNTGTQTFAGDKTFNGGLTVQGISNFNNAMNVTGDLDVSGILYADNNFYANSDSFLGYTEVNSGLAVNSIATITTDSTAALQVRTSGTTPVLTVDTVNSQTILKGINSGATLGSELVASQNFSSATYWLLGGGTWTATTTTATHATGFTPAITATALNVPVTSGATYQITFTITGNSTTTETLTPAIGGVSGPALGANGTHTVVITGTNTTVLGFTPTMFFDGTISAVSVKLVTLAKSVLTVQNSAGTANLEVRTSTQAGNQFIGLQAGQVNTTGTYNTASGYQSLKSNTTGFQNTASGAFSLQSNTTGSYNTATGYQSLQSNTTGSNNTTFGSNSLQSNTTGSNNTASGFASLNSNTTGSNNTASGSLSLNANTTGDYNTATGYWSLRTNATGTSNTATGVQSLYYNTTGNSNTASGANSLYSNTTGIGNTASGNTSLYSNTTGSYNIASGTNSLFSNTTGSYNTGLGYNAGYQDANGSHFVTSNNLQRATAIGAYAQVQQSDSIVLGSVDFATKVGIGTTVPLNTFSVSPLDYQTGTATRTNSSATLTGTGTTWTAAMVGDVIVFADGTTNTVTGFTSATSITMGTTYTGTTDASSVYYRFHKAGFQVANTGATSVQTTSVTAFQVQNNAGSSLFAVDTSANQVLFGKASAVSGKLVVANSTNANTVSLTVGAISSSYTLTLPTALGSTGQCLSDTTGTGTLGWANCGGGGGGGATRKITLVPEYPGATMHAGGVAGQSCTGNTGTVTSDWDNTNNHNYYVWSATAGTLQCYEVVTRTQIPSDYASAFGSFTVQVQAQSTSTANNDIYVQIKDNTAGTTCTSGTSLLSGLTAGVWAAKSVTVSGCTVSAGDMITIELGLSSKSSNTILIGEMSYQYTN